jgi:hypothetical protein
MCVFSFRLFKELILQNFICKNSPPPSHLLENTTKPYFSNFLQLVIKHGGRSKLSGTSDANVIWFRTSNVIYKNIKEFISHFKGNIDTNC